MFVGVLPWGSCCGRVLPIIMASIIKKRRGDRVYLYVATSARVDGQPRIVVAAEVVTDRPPVPYGRDSWWAARRPDCGRPTY